MLLVHLEGLENGTDMSVENCQTADISSISDQDYTSRATVNPDSGVELLGSLEQQNTTGGNNRGQVSTIPISSVSPPSSTGFDTLSSFSDEETDWAEDESDISFDRIGTSISAQNQGTQGHLNGERDLIRSMLTPVKQAVMDRIMKKFWEIFNAESVGSK
jgi:hypothetical protein